MRLRKILMVASVTFACVAQAQDLTIHVNKKGKVGFVDKNGAEVIKCAYESAYPFSGGYAIVTKSGKSGIIDERGKVVLPLKYTSIMPWNQSLYLIKTGKIQGWQAMMEKWFFQRSILLFLSQIVMARL